MSRVPGEFKRRVAGASISTVGISMLAIPFYDIYDDVTNLDWGIAATLAENSVLIFLSGVLVGGGLWLTRREWNVKYSLRVTLWSLGGTLVAGFVFAWVVGLQLLVMGEPKPFIIALDGILVGAVATFVIGTYDARSEFQRDRLATERDRLAGLFENTTDGIALVRFGESATVERTNERFDEFTEGIENPVEKALSQFPKQERPNWAHADGGNGDFRSTLGETIETELLLGDDGRQFLGRVVPLDERDSGRLAYLALTDVTEQKELAREREARERLATLQGVASAMISADDSTELRDIAIETVPRAVTCKAVYVTWDGVEGGGVSADGEDDPTSLLDDSVEERCRTDASEVASVGDGAGATVTELGDDELVTVGIGEGGTLQVRANGAFEESELEVLSLLATHLSRALARLDRENALEAERERLEFINRIVRHNLLNGFTVVRARTGRLREELDGELADAAETAHRRVEDMADLVDTMRQFTRAVATDTETELGAVDLTATLSRQVERLDRESDATVSAEVPDESVFVRADELLEQVFENLLTNAVVHNDGDPRVEVRVEESSDSTVTVHVADDGPGIPDDEREAVLEKGVSRLSDPSSGFGLYLVSEMVDTYGGDVEIEDNDPAGTIVSVTLPRA